MKIFPSGVAKKIAGTVSFPGEENNVAGLPWRLVERDGTVREWDEAELDDLKDYVLELSAGGVEGSFELFHNGVRQGINYEIAFYDEV